MNEPLQRAVTRMLAPLVRLLLRHGVAHAEFVAWSRHAYVREAARHFFKSKPPSVSRISIVTGIHRKEVKRLSELPDDAPIAMSRHNRAVRVVTGWLQDADFHDDNGAPLPLVYGDANDSFNQLVKRYGGDVPARALLDELERVGTVSISDEHQVCLLSEGYVPHESEQAMLDVFATSATDLLNTLDHNLGGGTPSLLQMTMAYDNVTDEGFEAFRKLGPRRAMTLLRELDGKLSEYDRDTHPDTPGTGSHRTGIGVYFIDQPGKDSDDEH